jgi:hypothetical protein
MNYPYIKWCQKIKKACDTLAEKHLKLAREHRERTVLIDTLRKMGTKSTPGLKSRQSLKDVGRSRISRTPQKKEPQMHSKQQYIMPMQLAHVHRSKAQRRRTNEKGAGGALACSASHPKPPKSP